MEILLPRMMCTHEIVGTHRGNLLPEQNPSRVSALKQATKTTIIQDPSTMDTRTRAFTHRGVRKLMMIQCIAGKSHTFISST